MYMIKTFLHTNLGGREQMEDEAVIISNFGGNEGWTFGAVFDGHGGDQVAKLAKEQIPSLFLKKISDGMPVDEAFREAYNQVSEASDFDIMGTTALSFLIQDDKLYVVNAGDSRLIVIDESRAKQITIDHSFLETKERERIESAGGVIYENRYLFSGATGLSVARSIGDRAFKKMGVIADPDVFCDDMPDKGYIIAGSDGLWNVLNNEEVAELMNKSDEEDKAKVLIGNALKKQNKSLDNISAIVVRVYSTPSP